MAKYWFKPKAYGFGATPNTWQGWVFTLAGVALIFAVVFEAKQITDRPTQMLVAISGVMLIAIPFTFISWLKTEGGWKWRSGKDE
jgi:hypothetical protein